MANTETSFGDRLSRAQSMGEAIAGFVPAFAPSDATLAPAAFQATLSAIEGLNGAVAVHDAGVSSATAMRTSLQATIRSRTKQVVAEVKSNKAFAAYLPAVKQAADILLGRRPGSAEPLPVPAVEPPKPKRKLRQQSYGDIDGFFEKVIKAVKAIPTYLPTETSNIRKEQLEALLEAFRKANRKLKEEEAKLSAAQKGRLAAYEDPETGLREKMKSIKEATKAQYGLGSAEFAAVKSIRV